MDKDIIAGASRHSSVVVASASLVCTVGRDSLFEWFLVDEGILIFVDGKKFKVLRNGISEQ